MNTKNEFQKIGDNFLIELTQVIDIPYIRKTKNLSQKKFGALIGVSKSTIASWEGGGNRSSKTAIKLLKII